MKNSGRLTKFLNRIIYGLFIVITLSGLAASSPMNDDPRIIEIVGQDNLRFSVEEIRAVPGETIRIIFTVKSALPRDAMSHNVVIVQPEIPMDEFVNKSMQARDNAYIAPSFKDQVIAATEMIGGGNTVEITFTVPETSGTYPYVCTFPGHYAAGMSGKLIVEDKKET